VFVGGCGCGCAGSVPGALLVLVVVAGVAGCWLESSFDDFTAISPHPKQKKRQTARIINKVKAYLISFYPPVKTWLIDIAATSDSQ